MVVVRRLYLQAKEVEAGKLGPEAIDEDLIAKHLMTDKLPYLYRDPDLIIRTSGELRLSNFLPWLNLCPDRFLLHRCFLARF